MPSGPYQAGMDLKDLNGTPTAGVDVRADGSTCELMVCLQTERGCATSIVQFFDPADLHELAGALRAAATRMADLRVAAGGPR